MATTGRTTKLTDSLKQLYTERSGDMLFHGWHHIYFVTNKALVFAEEFDVDTELIEAAALTHDLNYLVEVNSEPEAGKDLRAEYLHAADFTDSEIEYVEHLVMEEHTATRHADISDAAKALSDADTLFKALPITPIIFAGHFITENHIDIQRLAAKIVGEQKPLMEKDIYFYTDGAKNAYMKWATVNLQMWENVQEALEDETVVEMLQIAREMKAI
jgi:uncharacterized protein